MIEFVLGRSASGKTTYLFSLAENAIKAGGEVCLIVPEQESMTAERTCQEKYGEGITVLSFRRLCDTLMRTYGGAAKPHLGDVARLGILYRAVQTVKPKLKHYRKSADRVRFYEKLMSVMEDFAAYKANEQQVLPLFEKGAKEKYEDLFLIFESYNALRTQEYRDHFDDLDAVFYLLAQHSYFNDKTVLIDNFGGFTAQEYAVLEQIFLQAENCALTLLADPEEPQLFAPTLAHLSRLEQLCTQMGLAQKKVMLHGNHRFIHPNLSLTERYLFSSKRPAGKQPSDGSVRIFNAAGPDAEVRLVAQDIRRRVLSGECRYRDISVVSNVQDEYQHMVEMVFDELEIPLYTDRKVDVISRPLFSMILHAMDAVQYNYRFEDMFSLAATYLCGLDYEEVARLENYVFMWNIRGKKWEMEWTQNPFGLDSRESEESAATLLAQINDCRQRLITPLIEFAEDTRAGKATDLLAAVWRLLENYDVATQLKEFALSESDPAAGEQWLRLYDLLIELLDQLALVLGESEISRKTLHDMMEVCLRGYRFGVVPAYMDQVHFGDMIRARSGEVKHMYVLGANNGKFPAGVRGNGLITDGDIRLLREQNVLLSKDSVTVAKEQQFCLYRTLSSASHSLTFTYSGFSAEGKAQLPSGLITRLQKKLIQLDVEKDPELLTHRTDLVRAAMYFSKEDPQGKALADFLKDNFGTDIGEIRRKEKGEETLPQPLVEALYGKELSASQSRMDSFVSCPFKYFLQYGLKLKETEQITFAANYVGDFVHHGLEHLLNAVCEEEDITAWNTAKIDAFLEKIAREYYDEKMIDMSSPRFDHLFDRIKRTMIMVGRSAVEELKESSFRPMAQEYNFRQTIPLNGGMTASINGKVDRVDGMVLTTDRLTGEEVDETEKTADDDTVNRQLWLKIVDYKTGDKALDISKIYNGYQLQLPLYSKMLQSQSEFKDGKIAAMEYFLAGVPTFKEGMADVTENAAALADVFERKGLFLADENMVRKLDHTEKALYNNAPLKKEGGFYASAMVATAEQMEALGEFVEQKTVEIMNRMAGGEVSVCPMKQGENACQYCDFGGICRFEYGKSKVQKYRKLDLQEFFEEIKKGEA